MAFGSIALTAVPLALAPRPLAGQNQPENVRSFVAFVGSSGNTSVTTVNLGGKFVVSTRGKKIIFTQGLNVVYGSTDGATSGPRTTGLNCALSTGSRAGSACSP